MKTRFKLLTLLFLFGCSNTSVNKEKALELNTGTPISPAESSMHTNALLGIWTDGNSENATFEIKNDSIYYVDAFKSYNYSVQNDSIKIWYDDYVYVGHVVVKGDTLVLSNADNRSKFWRFKD